MYDRALFERICDLTCTFTELNEFVIGIDKKEFDTDAPFEKYYRADRLTAAIEAYQNKQIDANFLAQWMNAYDWIIMGGFQIKESRKVTLRDFLIWTISDWIDALSFFDGDDEWYRLEKYIQAFQVLDAVLQQLNDCSAVFAQHGYNDDDVVVLIVNNSAKCFIKVYGELDFRRAARDFKKVEFSDLENQAKKLSESGYRELLYSLWEEED